MEPSDAFNALCRASEGYRLKAYQDSKGVWTIGIGHTNGVTKGMTATAEQVENWFEEDTSKAVAAVNLLATPCTQGQFDALCDFAFNLGPHALAGSTLLRLHKLGDFAGAANEFAKWDHCDGVVVPGLLTRRLAEKRLYLS